MQAIRFLSDRGAPFRPPHLAAIAIFLLPSQQAAADCHDEAGPVESLMESSIAPGGYEPVWDSAAFWRDVRVLGGDPEGPGLSPVKLAMFVYFEENADDRANPGGFRTGAELKLYRQIKEFVRTHHQAEMLTPAHVADLALYAVRDDSGRANAQMALLTAHNVMRLLARPMHFTRPGRPVMQGDDLARIVDDLAGNSSVGGGKALPQLMYEQGRLKLSPGQLHGGVARPIAGADWSKTLFNPGAIQQLFCTMPNVNPGDEISNGGSHYYCWVGSLAQTVGGWPGSRGAVNFEAFIKWTQNEPEYTMNARRPGYETGVTLSQALEKYSSDSLHTLLRKLSQDDTGRLGLDPLTWRLITTRSKFLVDLRNNIANSQDYLTFHVELQKIAGMDLWPEQVEMLKLLGLRDDSKFQELLLQLDDELPALSQKDLHELTVEEFFRLRDFTAEHVLWLVGPRTIFRCRLELDPMPEKPDQVALEGELVVNGPDRRESVGGRREIEISLDDVKDLDRFIRDGAAVDLELAKPPMATQRLRLGYGDFRCESGLLVTEPLFIVPHEGKGKKKARVTVKRVNLVDKSQAGERGTHVRWEFDRLFTEHAGVGVTFNGVYCQGWRGDVVKMDQLDPVSFRVDPNSSYLHKDGHIAYSPYSAKDPRRGRLRCTYIGTDDNGNEIKVVDDIRK